MQAVEERAGFPALAAAASLPRDAMAWGGGLRDGQAGAWMKAELQTAALPACQMP